MEGRQVWLSGLVGSQGGQTGGSGWETVMDGRMAYLADGDYGNNHLEHRTGRMDIGS